jgi:hypothetical protein
MAKSKITISPINQGDVKKVPPEELPETGLVELVKVVVPDEEEGDELPVFPEKRGDVSGEIALGPEETDAVDTLGALAVLMLVPIVGVRTLLAVFITVYYINSNILLLSIYSSVI